MVCILQKKKTDPEMLTNLPQITQLKWHSGIWKHCIIGIERKRWNQTAWVKCFITVIIYNITFILHMTHIYNIRKYNIYKSFNSSKYTSNFYYLLFIYCPSFNSLSMCIKQELSPFTLRKQIWVATEPSLPRYILWPTQC